VSLPAPGASGIFPESSQIFSVPYGGAGLRDVLPLPLPTLNRATRSLLPATGKLRRQRRQKEAEAAAREIWSWLVIAALNYEYIGRYDCDHWKHRSQCSAAQEVALKHVSEAARYFSQSPLRVISMPTWSEEIKKRVVDYNGDENCHAPPLKLGELLPGFPEKGVAASVDALDLADDDFKMWVREPFWVLRPQNEWPESVPPASVQVRSPSDWHEVAAHLVDVGVSEVIPRSEIFTEGQAWHEWGVRSTQERGSTSW